MHGQVKLLRPVNLSLRIGQLEEFARGDAPSQTETTGYTKEGWTKDGKTISDKEPIETQVLERWGLWGGFDYYGDGRNLYQGSLGIDYRLAPHWLVGADARLGVINHNSGLGVAQGGVYTAFYERGFWAVAGTLLGVNQYTFYGGAGYDFFKVGPWLVGPVVNVQWDDATVDNGFGRGQLWQTRVGGRVLWTCRRFSSWAEVLYQNQVIDPFPNRENGVWAGTGVVYSISDHWSLFGGYAFEGNSNYQINQADAGLRFQF